MSMRGGSLISRDLSMIEKFHAKPDADNWGQPLIKKQND